MSTSAQIQNVRLSEQRFPSDLVHNGHCYCRGYRINSATIRKLRDIRRQERIIKSASHV